MIRVQSVWARSAAGAAPESDWNEPIPARCERRQSRRSAVLAAVAAAVAGARAVGRVVEAAVEALLSLVGGADPGGSRPRQAEDADAAERQRADAFREIPA